MGLLSYIKRQGVLGFFVWTFKLNIHNAFQTKKWMECCKLICWSSMLQRSALLYTSLDLVFQGKTNFTMSQTGKKLIIKLDCNVGLAVTCILSGPLSKIQVPKIKVAAFPGSFSSSSDQAEDCMWMGRQFWQQRSDWDCKRQRPAQSCLGLLITALYSMVEP